MKLQEVGENFIMKSFRICIPPKEGGGVRWTGNLLHMGDLNVYKILIGKSEGKRPLEIPRRR
jgi:hypothetical protein